MSDILVFITATIYPGSTPAVERTNPEERKQDYLRGFRSWITSGCRADILFCENSGADLADFKQIAEDSGKGCSVRFLSFCGNAGAETFGKGYGEIEMLKHAFHIMPELTRYRYILKVSGRYIYSNAFAVVEHIAKATADLICDIHMYLTYGDTRTVAFRPEVALRGLLPYQDELDENRGVIIENLMARCVHRTLLAGGTWAPLPCTPACEGISGSWNTRQSSSLYYRTKQDVKRRVARWIYRY